MEKNYFGFIPKKSIMKPIYFMQKLKEKYREKKRNFSMVFIYFEMVYDKGGLKGGISDGYKSKKGSNGICKKYRIYTMKR